MYRFLIFALIVCAKPVFAQTIISGKVTDAKSKEALLGATVAILKTDFASATDLDGKFSLNTNLKKGDKITIQCSYVGYDVFERVVTVAENPSVYNIALLQAESNLETVTVTARNATEQVRSAQMSSEALSVKELKQLPVLMGEVDLLKTLQLKPGIASGGEGSSGIFVRGGSSDQNLFLLENAPLYNPSHLFGFFSTFNSDAIDGVTLYKGGYPAQFGGKLSSVIDVNGADGNRDTWQFAGGLGLIASRLSAKGPLIKGKSSILLAARRTYVDAFIPSVNKYYENDKEFTKIPLYYFQDFNLKADYQLDKKNTLALFGFWGNDDVSFDQPTRQFGITWGNNSAGLRWLHQFSPKKALNTQVSRVGYTYGLRFGNPQLGTSGGIGAKLEDYGVTSTYLYAPDSNLTVKCGLQYTNHKFGQGSINFTIKNDIANSSINIDRNLYANELAVFGNAEYDFSRALRVSGGLRLSAWESSQKVYYNAEPRVNARYAFNDNFSIKANYARTAQYIHLLNSAAALLPTDIWYPANDRILPQTADQIATGFVWKINDTWAFTNEYYYKTLGNQSDFKQGAALFGNEQVDTAFVFGKGWSYGSEFYLEKTKGKLTGWISYTLAWTYRQFDSPDINRGQPFFPKNDRRHDIAVVAMYKLNKRLSLSGSWVYNSGQALTMPTGVSVFIDPVRGKPLVVPLYGERSNYRQPDYHRLDLGVVWKFKPKWGESDLTFSVYNAYNRLNTYFLTIDVVTDEKTGFPTGSVRPKSITLFPVLPSVTYNFKF